jgi:hypothetical protein
MLLQAVGLDYKRRGKYQKKNYNLPDTMGKTNRKLSLYRTIHGAFGWGNESILPI